MSIFSSIGGRLFSIIKNTLIIITWIIGAILIISAYCGYCNPKDSARVAILGMIFPIMLYSSIAILAIWLIFRKWLMALLVIAFMAACWDPILTFSPFNIGNSATTASDKTFKVLTYNVMNFASENYQKDTGNDKALQYILNEDADIVLLQEASAQVKMDELTPLKNMLPILDKKYPYRDKNIHDLIILSKYPYEVTSYHITENAPNKSIAYKVTMDSVTLHFINVHLESIRLNDSDKALYRSITDISKSPNNISEKTVEDVKSTLLTKLAKAFKRRANQAEDLKRYITSLGDENIILCGDFNDTPYSYSYLTIKGDDMEDAYKNCALGPAITFHANRFYFRIDHILYKGKNIEAIDIKRGDEKHSDHYPLTATFKWK